MCSSPGGKIGISHRPPIPARSSSQSRSRLDPFTQTVNFGVLFVAKNDIDGCIRVVANVL